MRLFQRLKNLLVPTYENAYRPGIFERRWLLFFLGVILIAEGFLITNLVGREYFADFITAVIGSEIVTLTNTERAHAHTQPLVENPLLSAAAQRKAEDMARGGYFSHVGPDGKPPWAWIAEEGYEYRYAGENLAVRFIDSSDVVQAWMASESHRANIVNPVYRDIGIGVAHGAYKGASATFVVQFFGTPSVSAAPVVARQRIQREIELGATEERATEVAGAAADAQAAPEPAKAGSGTIATTLARAAASPRAVAAAVLFAVAVVLAITVVTALAVHPQIQPGDLLLRGSLVIFLALSLVAINAQALSILPGSEQAAAIVLLDEGVRTPYGVVIEKAGASVERFLVEY